MFRDKYDNQIEQSGTVEKYIAEASLFMYQFAAMVAKQGNNVIIDGVLLETSGFMDNYNKSRYEIAREALTDFDILMVEVYCPLDECKKRNIARKDRRENQSHEQQEIMSKNIKYDFYVDTSVCSTEECAKLILNKFFWNKN